MVMLDNSNNNNNNNKITKYFLLFASNKLLVMVPNEGRTHSNKRRADLSSKYGMTCDIIIHSKYFSVSDCLQSPANSL